MGHCSVNHCENLEYVTGLCSKHYNRKRQTGSVEDGPRARAEWPVRFWRQIDKRGPDECWPWIAKATLKGYGIISTGGRSGKKLLSNRAAWLLANGDLPEDKVVRHKCHNRSCCNPAHLELGSAADNVADMWARPASVPRGNARLSEQDVAAIRSDPRSSRQLAPIYGVSHAHIRSIRSGRTWAAK